MRPLIALVVVVVAAACGDDGAAVCADTFAAYKQAVATAPFDPSHAAYEPFLAQAAQQKGLGAARCKANQELVAQVTALRPRDAGAAYVEAGSPTPTTPTPTPPTPTTPTPTTAAPSTSAAPSTGAPTDAAGKPDAARCE